VPAKRYSVEQIVAKLREAEKLQGQGLTIPQACKRLGISDQTFYRWRIREPSACALFAMLPFSLRRLLDRAPRVVKRAHRRERLHHAEAEHQPVEAAHGVTLRSAGLSAVQS